jgi:hypothetical protein
VWILSSWLNIFKLNVLGLWRNMVWSSSEAQEIRKVRNVVFLEWCDRLAHPGGPLATNKAVALGKFLKRKLSEPGGAASLDPALVEQAVNNAKATVEAGIFCSSCSCECFVFIILQIAFLAH